MMYMNICNKFYIYSRAVIQTIPESKSLYIYAHTMIFLYQNDTELFKTLVPRFKMSFL